MGKQKKNKYAGRSTSASSYQPVVQRQRTYVSTGTHIEELSVRVTSKAQLKSISQQTTLSETASYLQNVDPFPLDNLLCPLATPDGEHLEDRDAEPGNVKVEKAKRYVDSDAPLLNWKEEHREHYLACLMLTEGRGRFSNGCCSGCGRIGANYRCRDCHGLSMKCQLCIVKDHRAHPLHNIEEWSANSFFQAASLRELGLKIQLGHPLGHACDHPNKPQKEFVVLHWNGIHTVHLTFCGCSNAPDYVCQLMEIGWFPASYKDPHSAATFELLRNFHITNLQGHLPPTDFYRSLEKMRAGTGLVKLPDRLEQFRLVLREWRHLKMMKRCGRGHDPSGIAGTPSGGAAVLCRACPHPGINLPDDWMMAPSDKAWLYTLILAQDANFKQKARTRPIDDHDPSLGAGMGCLVDHGPYLQEAAQHAKDVQPSDCSVFSAMVAANSKKSRGLRATGIASVTCARHETFLPNGTGDLQKGERQFNMDWVFLSAILRFCELLNIVVSYDIVCQWMIHFYDRMSQMPRHLQMPPYRSLQFKIPKFHLPAHKPACHAPFALNYTNGVGKVDAEGPERKWSVINPLARSLSMMSAGGRWDTMDDHCNNDNYKKMIKLDTSLMKKLIKAISEAVVFSRTFLAFDDALSKEHADTIEKWKRQLREWEHDHNKPCPYEMPTSEISMSGVKKQIIEEELVATREKDTSAPSSVIIEGLEIEETQRSIAQSMTTAHTVFQETNINQRRTALVRRIHKYRDVQMLHIHNLGPTINTVDSDTSVQPEAIHLLLPSDSHFTTEQRLVLFSPKIIAMELRLREAQAFDALAALRNQLRARSAAAKHKDNNLPSQGMYTRQRALQDQISDKIRSASDTYRAVRDAIMRLRGPGPWTNVLRELRAEDVRGINERVMREEEKALYRRCQLAAGASPDEVDEVLGGMYGAPTLPISSLLECGESKKPGISWIWYTISLCGLSDDEVIEREGATPEEIEASLRVEWCKSRARACRAKEELILVEEEMRRALEFCHYQSRWWRDQSTRRTPTSPWHAEGLAAYAAEQASIEQARANAWSNRWNAIRARAREVFTSLHDAKAVESLSKMEQVVIEMDLNDDTNSDD